MTTFTVRDYRGRTFGPFYDRETAEKLALRILERARMAGRYDGWATVSPTKGP